ncbi:MAG TPA: serine hydroxymethyltransferase, partial [Candidatus Dojkabacteria bacterium]|nr:serine hydroxymethyltransferase [Candidatus Dojkabacteria bacterium]
LMNKYAEGQPGKRYYQGMKNVDDIESLVEKRALQAFGLDDQKWMVNVQPAGGSIANLAVYNALLNPGDTIMAMSLYDGGHLSHGWQLPDGKKISFTSKIFNPVFYGVDQETGLFDYEKVMEIAKENKPKLIISGGTAYPRQIDHKKLREIADEVGAYYMADIAHEAGLIIAGVNNSPFEFADVVTMTTRKTLRGPVGAMIFAKIEYGEAIDKSVFPGLQGGPQIHTIAGIGVALFEAMQPAFKQYALDVIENAKELARLLKEGGYDVVTGGTDKHLILVDLRNKNLGGTEIANALESANIIINKNTVPGETGKPWRPSGIRMGTPAITTRGVKKEDMIKIYSWIDKVIKNYLDYSVIGDVAKEVKEFALLLKKV